MFNCNECGVAICEQCSRPITGKHFSLDTPDADFGTMDTRDYCWECGTAVLIPLMERSDRMKLQGTL